MWNRKSESDGECGIESLRAVESAHVIESLKAVESAHVIESLKAVLRYKEEWRVVEG